MSGEWRGCLGNGEGVWGRARVSGEGRGCLWKGEGVCGRARARVSTVG